MFGIAVLTTCALNLFLPLAAKSNWVAVVVVRVLQGLAEVSYWRLSLPLTSK